MRSAAYKSLQERATRTVCSQATLPLYWLADIQFFQSFPEWHGVKFVAHHLCPRWLVTACTLWHSKQSNPNLLPAFEIRRGEGPWNADGSIWCFVKAEVPDHRYEENENQPLENPQAPETAHVRNMIGRGRLEVSVFVLLPDSPWSRAPGLLSRAGLNPPTSNAAQQWLWGCSGSPSTLMKPLPIGRLKGRAAEEPYKSHSSWAGAKQGGAHLCQGTQAAFLIPSPCVAWLVTEEFGLLTLLLCCFTSCVGSCPEHHGTGRDAELLRKQSLGSQHGTQELPRQTESQNISVFFESSWKKIWTALCKNIYSIKKFRIRKGNVTIIFQSTDEFTLFWKQSIQRKYGRI